MQLKKFHIILMEFGDQNKGYLKLEVKIKYHRKLHLHADHIPVSTLFNTDLQITLTLVKS